jgi:hypothetical protein
LAMIGTFRKTGDERFRPDRSLAFMPIGRH